MEYEKLLLQYRDLFTHKAVSNQGDGIYVIQGRLGKIYPYSLDGSVLGVNYDSDPSFHTTRIKTIQDKLKPYTLTFEALDGGYEATFSKDYLKQVAGIIGVIKRGKPRGMCISRYECNERYEGIEEGLIPA